MSFTIIRKVGKRGEIVLPKPIREALGLTPGREVNITLEEDEVRIRHRSSLKRTKELIKQWRDDAIDSEPPEPWLLDSDKAWEERFKDGRDAGIS